jgi:hypothetical protein
MKISEIQNFLTKAATLVGDAPTIIQDAESEVETELKAIAVVIRAEGDPLGTVVSLIHGAVTPAATLPVGTISPEPSE